MSVKIRKNIRKAIFENALKKSDLLSEAIAVDYANPAKSMMKWEMERQKCNITEATLPDDFLAIFFGDQLLSPAGFEIREKGILDDMASQDVLLSKIQVAKTKKMNINRISPMLGNIVRKTISKAIDLFFPGPFAKFFCNQLATTATWFKKNMAIWAVIFGDADTIEDAEKAQKEKTGLADPQQSVDLTKIIDSCYKKVSKHEYVPYARLNVADKHSDVLMLFQLTCQTLQGSDTQKDVTDLYEKETKLAYAKGNNSLMSRSTFFQNEFLKIAFKNTTTNTANNAIRLCKVEIGQVNSILDGLDAITLVEVNMEIIQNFVARVKNAKYYLEKIYARSTPDGGAIISAIKSPTGKLIGI